MCTGSSTWASADTMRKVAMRPNSSLTRVSGSGPLIEDVTVCDLAETPFTQMTVRLLADLGMTIAPLDDADVVLDSGPRAGGRADSIWATVTPFGSSGPRSS